MIEPDSSPMVERRLDEEPPIAETEAARSRSPSAAARRRPHRKPRSTVTEPAPADAPPAETADQAAPPAKPARKRRSKAAEAAPAATEPMPVPAANNDTADEDESGAWAGGWWQRTFG